MKIYVASSGQNILEVLGVMGALRAAGHEITHDWTPSYVEYAKLTSESARVQFLKDCGVEDIIGILNAEAVVLIAHPEMRDARVEFGIALGKEIPAIVMWPDRSPSVFYPFAAECVDSVDALLKVLQ